jgi:hypothetical protein
MGIFVFEKKYNLDIISLSSNIHSMNNTELLDILRARFEKNMHRHAGLEWDTLQSKLEANPAKLASISQMEDTGGEPDVVNSGNEYLYVDCAPESPTGRRSLCYDDIALASRRENKPKGSAVDMATNMGVELLTEEQYRNLQKLGEFDMKTSSWIATPAAARKLGGAFFCDRRFDTVFVYHNGAESYYAGR